MLTEPGGDLPGDRVQTHETAAHSAQSPVPSSPLAAPRLPGAIQAKLVVGRINDPLEDEADRVADEVMRVPEPPITAAPPQISRKCASCGEDEEAQTLQTKRAASEATAGEAPGIVHEVLRSPGRPLEASERGFMEPRFGHDLGDVRIHTETPASRSTEALTARAYTVGRDVALRHGEYAANTTEGRRLLAHELAHVLQQRQTSLPIPGASQPIRPGALTTRLQRQAAATEPMRPADLDHEYQTAVQMADWQAAAEWLNAFNYKDIQARLAQLTKEQVANLHQGAASNPSVGAQSQVAQLTEPGRPPASFPSPTASTPPPPSPEAAPEVIPANAMEAGQAASPGVAGRLPPGMSATDKMVEAFHRADISAAVREKILSMITPKALVGAIIGFAVVFVASQFTPVGWAADLALGLTIIFVGNALLTAIHHLINFAAARNATTTEQLDRTGEEFARAVAEIEIDAILLLVTHAAGSTAEGGTPYEGPPPGGLVLATTRGRLVPVVAETIPLQIGGQLAVMGGATVMTMAGRPTDEPPTRDFEPAVRDHQGKVGGEIPENGEERKLAVDSWTREELESAATELEESIAVRQAEQKTLGETSVGAQGQRVGAAHRVRIDNELELLRAIRKKLNGS